MSAPEPCAAPPPDPGRLLLAAQLISIGEPLSLAAARAGLRPDQLRALRDDPASGFAELLADAEAQAALPQPEQDIRHPNAAPSTAAERRCHYPEAPRAPSLRPVAGRAGAPWGRDGCGDA